MKRVLAVGLALPALTVADGAHAAEDDEDRVHFGPAFGVTMSGESNVQSAISRLTSGYAYTYFTPATLTRPMIGLRVVTESRESERKRTIVEIQYTQFGSRVGPFAISKHMLSVPIIHQWDANGGHRPITPHWEIGLQPSFRLATRATSRFVAYGGYIADYWHGYGFFRQPFDLGATVGFGIGFPVENTRANLDLRFYHGVVPKNSPIGLSMNRQLGVFGGITF